MASDSKIPASTWASGPARPRLVKSAVHVWRADLAATGEGHLEGLLSEEERERAGGERAGRYALTAERRLLRARSRAVLRALLGRYLQTDGRELCFTSGEHGKPALAVRGLVPDERAPARGRLFFNLSHSGTVALYAVSAGCEVGVDVERVDGRGVAAQARMARRLLGDERGRALEDLAPDARRRELFDAWTRYEAEVKCRGTGIGAGVPLGDVSPPGTLGQASCWVATLNLGPGLSGAVSQPVAIAQTSCWVAALDLGPGLSGAVAAAEPATELHCWSWVEEGARAAQPVGTARRGAGRAGLVV
jgi:4'-phosphopantetheinyl transferase